MHGRHPREVRRKANLVEATIVKTIDEVGLDERGWNSLVACSDTNSVFQTHQWTRSWWTAFATQYEPVFVRVSDASEVVGVAPLVMKRDGTRKRVIRFLGDGRADYCDFLTGADKPNVLAEILGALFRRGWDVVELNNIPAHSRTLQIVREISGAHGYRTLAEDQFVCPTLLIEGHEAQARKIHNKPSLRRRENFLNRNGRLVCRHLTGISDIEPFLDQFFDQHVARWMSSKSPSLFLDGRNRTFYRGLAASLAAEGWVVFSIVEFNNQPIAFHYGFDYGGTVTWYKPSFDVGHASWSPGLVLVRQLIGYALEQKRRELDFTVGDEPFKTRFTNSTRKTVSIRVYQNPLQFVLDSSTRWASRVLTHFSGGYPLWER
jgi:CelD/BcsL family acetyltransferase involved in cellulose biosynthesis